MARLNGLRWFSAVTVVFLVVLLNQVPVEGAITFLSTPPGNAIYGQNIAFMCNDSAVSTTCNTDPSPPECSSSDPNFNKISYSRTLSDGTTVTFGTCSSPQTVSGWDISWPSCDKASSSLIISNVTMEVEGEWKCTSGGSTQTLTKAISYPPMLDYKNAIISPPPPVIKISLNLDKGYSIKVKANPAVTSYTESCIMGVVASRLKLIQRTAGKEYLLSLKAAKYSDYGNHICRIKNSIGVLTLTYLVRPVGPTFTISKGAITAVSVTIEWPSQSGGTYTPSYIIYYKQTNQTQWIASNEANPMGQTAALKMKYKQTNLVPDSFYDFKVKLVIVSIKHMDAAESSLLPRVGTYSSPNITDGNIKVTTDEEKGETFVAWDKFVGHYTHMRVKYCLLDAAGSVQACELRTISDPKQLKVVLDLKPDRKYSFYFYVLDGMDVVFESGVQFAQSAKDDMAGVKLSGAVIGGIVVGIIAACLVLTAGIIVGVRVMRKRKEERLKARANHSDPKARGRDRQGVRFNDTGHDNPSMIPDPYYQVPENRRPANGNPTGHPTATMESNASGIYEPVDDDGSRFYETPLPSPPQKPYDPTTYASLNAERIYLNVPPPKGLASVGQTSPKPEKHQRIYENVPMSSENQNARPPDVATINHIYVNTGFRHGSGSVDDGGLMPRVERVRDSVDGAPLAEQEDIDERF